MEQWWKTINYSTRWSLEKAAKREFRSMWLTFHTTRIKMQSFTNSHDARMHHAMNKCSEMQHQLSNAQNSIPASPLAAYMHATLSSFVSERARNEMHRNLNFLNFAKRFVGGKNGHKFEMERRKICQCFIENSKQEKWKIKSPLLHHHSKWRKFPPEWE